MFAARGIAVSLSVFSLLYVALSLSVCCLWRRIWLYSQRFRAKRCANLLFAWRMLPLATAAASTLILAVPSFLLLEPRATDERVGAAPLVLGFFGFMILAAGAGNAILALVRASKTMARWNSDASVARSFGRILLLRGSRAFPTLVAAGILRPKVLLSHRAEIVLTPKELQTALQHELAHVRRLDNLRKLLIRFAAFPGMAELESSWRQASEMAADDAAVFSASEALDLAAALIKLSRLGPLEPPGELTTALVHSPAESVNARVERLIAWTDQRQIPAGGYSLVYAACGAAVMLATVAVNYSGLLIQVHAATEWLVR
ncbi:MAG: M56 family metallopeptidase [Candidatus Sulfotelmatobacter sp.]